MKTRKKAEIVKSLRREDKLRIVFMLVRGIKVGEKEDEDAGNYIICIFENLRMPDFCSMYL